MAIKVGELFATLGLDKSGYTAGLKDAGSEASTLQKATDKTFGLIAKAAKIAFAAVSAVVVKSVIDATKFEAQMANVATMLDKRTMPMLDQFKKDILTASKSFGEGTKTLTKGLYDILSASIPAEKAIDVLKVSLLAAKAGMTDTGVAADVITTLINAFGDSAENANYYSDVLFTTVKRGKITFGELASSIGTVATLGAKAGVSVQELGAMMAILTRNGLDSSIASTALRGALTGLLKPSEEAVDTARELGIEFGLSAIKAHGFEGVMKDLAGLPADVLTKLFPNVRGLTAIITAADSMGDEMQTFTDIMADGSPTMEAWEKQSGTMQVAWDRLKATFKAVSINMGDKLLPTVKDIIDAFRQWLDENQDRFIKFAEDLLDLITNLVTTIGEWKEVIIAAGIAIGGLMVAQKVAGVIIALNAAFAAGAGPIGLVIAGLSTLVYLFLKVAKHSRQLKDDQELVDSAMSGSARSVEDYDEALEILNRRIEEQTTEYEKLAAQKGSGISFGRSLNKINEKEIETLKAQKAEIEANREARARADGQAELAMKQKADAEMKAYIEEQKRIQAEIAADETREQAARDAARAEAQRLAAKLKIMDKIREAEMTDEERIKARAKYLRKLGIAEVDIIKTLKIEYADYYKKIEEAEDEAIERADRQREKQEALLIAKLELADGTVKLTKATKKETEANEDATDVNFDLEKSFKKLKMSAADWSDFLATSFTSAWESAWSTTKDFAGQIKDAVKGLFADLLRAIGKQLIVAAAGYALTLQWGKAALAAATSALAFIGASFIEGLEKGGLVGDKYKGIEKKAAGGLFEGKPGIDTNVVALTSGEYVVNKDATAKNLDTLEAINAGESGGISIIPAPVMISIDGREVGRGVIEFLTEESDRGSFRINPKVVRSNI